MAVARLRVTLSTNACILSASFVVF
ncbi:hypothetical protein LINGRAHAP2_LOCUS4129 [Linum grandiflorum]